MLVKPLAHLIGAAAFVMFGYTQTTKNAVNAINIIGAIVLVGLVIWGLSHIR